MRVKIALQEICECGLESDKEFPEKVKLTSHLCAKQLPEAAQVKIPSCYRHYEEKVEDVSLLTFVNAS